MKKYTGIVPVIILLLSFSIEAQTTLFKPFTSFRVIKTERFDIIFPRESEPSARLLATYADDVYRNVSSLLGIDVPGRIAVTFSPHTDLFNGYFNPVGNHIVLYDTPMDLEWTNFANNLESLFLHELTHAVSLNTRSPYYRGLNFIFGGWATPSLFSVPLFMVEGVTVSFESLDGFGRASDPLLKQNLRQAVYENEFLNPFQTSGVYDLPIINRGYYYEYGGLFSAWLQQTYGMEKYAELWQAMGRDRESGFSFFVYRSGYYRIFKNVYNVDFPDAWKRFGDSFAIGGIEENGNEIFPRRHHFFSERESFILFLAAGGKNLYAAEGRRLHVYDTRTGAEHPIDTDVYRLYDLDVDPQNGRIIVSGYRYSGDRYIAAVTEFTETGRRTGRSIRGLYKARYFRGGVVGIRSALHNNCIVYEDFDGNSEILFRGNEELLFSGPQVLDNDRIVFVAAKNGIRELWLFDYASGGLFRIEAEGGDEYWAYMRGLNVSEGKIFFSHNADDRMYKLASLDLENMEAVFSSRDFSGGVFSPVSVNGEVYYVGTFAAGNRLMKFPETADAISGEHFDLKLTRLDRQNFEAAATEPPFFQTKPYFALRYINPLRFWLPLPLIRTSITSDSINYRLDGGGLISAMIDPTARNFVIVMAYADIPYRMARVDNFSWQNSSMGFPLTLEFSDTVEDDRDDPYRTTRGRLGGTVSWSMGRWSTAFSLAGLYARFADYDDGKTAYEWKETGSVFAISSGLGFSSRVRRQGEMFGTGLSLSLRAASIISNFEPYIAGLFRATAETRFPFSLSLYGAYDQRGMNLHGVSRVFGTPLFSGVSSSEYPNPDGLNLSWLAGGEAALGLFSFEIQKNISHIYANRLSGSLALRSAVYDSKGHPDAEGIAMDDLRLAQSLVLKVNMVFSAAPLKPVPFFLEPYVWGAWKFSNEITGKGYPWYINAGFNFSY